MKNNGLEWVIRFKHLAPRKAMRPRVRSQDLPKSGGRDLSGNKRTNKEQSFDQKFEKSNQALQVSCIKGYPVRVVRSFKEKRSSYAPEKGVRYGGVYRIEKCWRKIGIQSFRVCRYLFVRCDYEPAPWTSDEHGDQPRPLPVIKELKGATDVRERKDSASCDYDEQVGWKWMKAPPVSKKPFRTEDPDEQKKEFSCPICHNVMTSPLTTPCAHNLCKPCLLGAYIDQSFVRERVSAGGWTLRAQKIVKKCPTCPIDISEFLQNPQVNRELMDLIESLKRKSEEEKVVEDGCEGVEEKDITDDGIGTSDDKKSGGKENGDAEVNVSMEAESGGLDDKKLGPLDEDARAKTVKRSRPDKANSPSKRKKAKTAPKKAGEESVDVGDNSPSTPG